ncbi:MAG: hypothetical protein BAA02_03980 [Paenibacillaceae bacterium ZCTH02-B3]|nr:MAG: hypothetical protein BAA02_03980 [Paenibacillaceae bacterium ZCTH02-B3]
MRKMVEAQLKLVPDLLRVMRKRYEILRQIRLSGKTGRRTLAASVNLTERSLRTELDVLREQGLVEIGPSGMALSAEGERLLEELEPFVREWFGLTRLEEALREAFGLKRVIVVPGDSDQSEAVKQEMGRAAARVLVGVLKPGDVVAVMGGTTMACVASHMQSSTPLRDNWFVPARGGLGESVDVQASTVASEMAKRTGARYRMLHVPDHLGEEAYQTMMQEPNVREVVEMIRSARIIVHGIGEAMTMARRRKLDERTMEELRREGAVAEAFGYYFDRSGAVVYRRTTVGLRLQDLERADTVIGVAGGRSKGEAIAAVLRYGQNDILVTDEAAAEEALKTMESRPG